jgi:serine/threonine protein kinase
LFPIAISTIYYFTNPSIGDLQHEHNVVHCDIKPENIVLMDKKLTVKFSDFGLATTPGEDGFINILCVICPLSQFWTDKKMLTNITVKEHQAVSPFPTPHEPQPNTSQMSPLKSSKAPKTAVTTIP